ncbi:MAG: hypothetical protein AAGF11_51765 [Myxococcota bacterium]
MIIATAALGVGCAKSAPKTMAPHDVAGGAAGAAAAPDESAEAEAQRDQIAEIEAELERYEASMLEAGVELPEPVQALRRDAGQSATPATAGDPAQRCQRICDLSANMCTLRDRICELADEHADDPRYTAACERAGLDCDRATEACEGCDA